VRLPPGWEPVEPTAFIEDELRREMAVGHVLYGRAFTAVARRSGNDDVAFLVDGSRLCIVHLTWAVETRPEWPWTVFVETLEEGDE